MSVNSTYPWGALRSMWPLAVSYTDVSYKIRDCLYSVWNHRSAPERAFRGRKAQLLSSSQNWVWTVTIRPVSPMNASAQVPGGPFPSSGSPAAWTCLPLSDESPFHHSSCCNCVNTVGKDTSYRPGRRKLITSESEPSRELWQRGERQWAPSSVVRCKSMYIFKTFWRKSCIQPTKGTDLSISCVSGTESGTKDIGVNMNIG